MTTDEVLRIQLQELRRGTVVVASLIALRRADYGYALLQRLTLDTVTNVAVAGTVLVVLWNIVDRVIKTFRSRA